VDSIMFAKYGRYFPSSDNTRIFISQ